jgi:hypothetical protein
MKASARAAVPAADEIESALRHLGTRNRGTPLDTLKRAVERPDSPVGEELMPLVEAVAPLDDWTTGERAQALWLLVLEGVHDPDVSPSHLSRRRHALYAAFRIADSGISAPWRPSLAERFRQLKELRQVFGEPTTTQPMEMAWKRGVQHLARYLSSKLTALATPEDWEPYHRDLSDVSAAAGNNFDWLTSLGTNGVADLDLRKPSQGAQPLFVNLFITTVFMKRRAAYRRITERLVTAQVDGVAFYTARGFAGTEKQRRYAPVQALWGCRAEYVEPPHPSRPAITRLWFPAPLRRGEQAYFASEVMDENITAQRDWIDVDVDHHGIDRGRLAYDGRFPVSGLTIRIRFDGNCVPEAAWWYAELIERERYEKPPAGDRHLLEITSRDLEYTFTEHVCQPRESYGISFSWPRDDAE